MMDKVDRSWIKGSLERCRVGFLFDLCVDKSYDVVILCGLGLDYRDATEIWVRLDELMGGSVRPIIETERNIHHYLQDGVIKPKSKILFVTENPANQTIQGMVDDLSPASVDWEAVGVDVEPKVVRSVKANLSLRAKEVVENSNGRRYGGKGLDLDRLQDTLFDLIGFVEAERIKTRLKEDGE